MMQIVHGVETLRSQIESLSKERVGQWTGLCKVPGDILRLGATPTDDEEVYRAEAEEGSERNGSGCEGESVKDCSYDD